VVTLDRDDIGADWPLIRYLLDDPVYYERYVGYIEEAIAGPFDPETLERECRDMAELIAPYAAAEVGEPAFDSAVQQLIERIHQRHEAATDFVSGEGA